MAGSSGHRSRLARPPLVWSASINAQVYEWVAECARNGWSWLEPVGIQEHLRTYSFWTNANARGGNAYVVVDIHDGRVRRKGFNPR